MRIVKDWGSYRFSSSKIFGLFSEFIKTEYHFYFCCWIIWRCCSQKNGNSTEYVFLALYSEQCSSSLSYNEKKRRWTSWAAASDETNPFRKVSEWGHTNCILFEDVSIGEFLKYFTSVSKAEEGFIRDSVKPLSNDWDIDCDINWDID